MQKIEYEGTVWVLNYNNPEPLLDHSIHMLERHGVKREDMEITETKENHRNYASCTIRRHKKGKSIPLHKDNVSYEGVEYQVSKINNQLSCILHLQETEKGGNLSIYNKQWEKKLEKHREIEFGYNPVVKKNTEADTIKSELGDLVIINPNYLHEVKKIQGNSDRVTLGIFFGIENKTKKIFSWA